MSNTHDFEVIIIGASITGASLAHQLGSIGIKTALIDKQKFPRRKPCGEGLSAFAAEPLRKLGLADTLQAAQKVELTSYKLHLNSFTIPIPIIGTKNDCSYGIDRCILDNAIFNKASSHSSVETILGQRVSKIETATSTVWIDSHPIKGNFIILASGLNNFFKENISYSTGLNRYGLSVQVATHSPHKLNSVEIFLFPKFQLFVTPIDTHRLNISALGSVSAIKNLAQLDMNQALSHVSAQLNLTLAATTPILGAGPFGRRATRRILGNIILAGDTYESLDPIGGMGMAQGLLTAHHLGLAIQDIIQLGRSPQKRLETYSTQMDRAVLTLKLLTSSINVGLTKILSPFNQKLEDKLPTIAPQAA